MYNNPKKARNMGNYKKIIFSVILILLVSIIAIFLWKFLPRDNLCLTSVCVEEAANILQSLDETVSPCDDFYEFSCGKWRREKELPDNQDGVNQYSELKDDLNRRIKGLITGINTERDSREFVRNLKNNYESCINTTLLEELGDKPLFSLLDRLGGWPLVSKGQWKQIKWDDLYIRLSEEGFSDSTLFSASVTTDSKNNLKRILFVSQPSFGLGSRDSVLKGDNDPIVKAYKNLMFKTIIKMGGNLPEKVHQDVEDIFKFETLLAQNSMARELRRNVSAIYDKMTINELTHIAPNINWLKILKGKISHSIRDYEPIVSFDTNYIKFVNSILPRYKNEFIVNLMIWRTINWVMPLLNEEWFKLKEEFYFIVRGTKSRLPRSKMCLGNTNKMHHAISHLYIKNFFNQENKEKAKEMFANVVKEFRFSLQNNQWMAENTRKEAIKKLDKMQLMVGYPEELAIEKNIEDHYRFLKLSPTEYFDNNLRHNKWNLNYIYSRFRELIDPNDWRDRSFVAVINAFYFALRNLFMIPAGILQGEFFHKDRPKYLNYGGIGSIAGHEIIHGFDDSGRQYDSEGKLRNWWDKETDRLYTTKSQCFVRQYSNFTVKEIGQNLNGINTQGENIADNGGILQAYRAYLRHVDENGAEPTLPGLSYTPEKLFWIINGVKRCAKNTIESLKLIITNGQHSPSRFRVNGVAMNSPEFSSVFNCPVGSPMNPIQKCKIW